MRLTKLICAVVLLCSAGTAFAVPQTVSFTARITDTDGNAATGPLSLKVTLFDAESAGTLVWEETHANVPVDNGLVYLNLGSIAPTTNGLGPAIFDGRPLFAELTVDGDVMSPRIPIATVPYATRAEVADTLQGFDPATKQQRVTGTCSTSTFITAIADNGSVTCGSLTETGDISAVNPGNGLTGGGMSGAVTLSVDTTAIQARVTGTCATGTFITAVAANGGVTCGTEVGLGDITGVNPGAGLTGGGATGTVSLSVDTTTIQARVTGTCATGTFITAVAANGGVTCGTETGLGDITGVNPGTGLTGGGATGTVTLGIANSGVTAAQIADGAVTMAKTSGPIGTLNVTTIDTSSINGSQTSFSTGNAFTADSNGTCLVTAWAGANTNAPFWVQPALRTGGTTILSNAYAPAASTSGTDYSHAATATGTIGVTAGTTYQVGCQFGTVGFGIGTPACRVSWICN
ncbi:MAG: hypothetical protein AB7T06_27550 [Kofleriaceae bacterium]